MEWSKELEKNIDEETDNPEALAEELKDIVPDKVKIFLPTFDAWRCFKGVRCWGDQAIFVIVLVLWRRHQVQATKENKGR